MVNHQGNLIVILLFQKRTPGSFIVVDFALV